MPSPLALLVLFSANGPFSWLFSPENTQKILTFCKELRLFLFWGFLLGGSEMIVGSMCGLLRYGTGICHYAFILTFLLFVSIPFSYFAFIWCRWIRWNGPWYQLALTLCVLLTRVLLKGIISAIICVWCLCRQMYDVCVYRGMFCFMFLFGLLLWIVMRKDL